MKAPCTELVIPAEIVIGTVPLREAFHYLPSAQFDTTVPSQLPSAPFANQPSGDNFQIGMPHITPILRSLQWLKINERIEYKLLSLTYKVLTPANLTTYTILSLFSLQVELAPHLLSP